jgi:hypothetical protein
MERQAAEDRAKRLNAEHPERDRYRWAARPADDAWEVVRIDLPSERATATAQHAAEGPPTAEDPRPSYDRSVGGPWVGT